MDGTNTVLPVSTVFLTVRMTIAEALASHPDVSSAVKIMEGLATSSTAIVSLLRCSVERQLTHQASQLVRSSMDLTPLVP